MKRKSAKKVKLENSGNSLENYTIAKTSSEQVTIQTGRSGSYLIFVSDTDTENGAHSIFVCTKTINSDSGSISRLSSSRGTEGQSIDAHWLSGEELKIYHNPAGTGDGYYNYRVKIYSAVSDF